MTLLGKLATQSSCLHAVMAVGCVCALGGAWPGAARAQTAELPAVTTPSEQAHWPTTRDWIDYSIVGASLGGFYALHSLTPKADSGIGPSFDAQHPGLILDPKHAGVIGRRHLIEDKEETVPALYVGLAVPAVGLWLGLQERFAAQGSARQAHDTVVGLAESMATTLLVTELAKYQFGRLRPDFADRVRRYYCTTEKSPEIACTGNEVPLDADPAKAAKIFADGRRSFPSGHAATSFVLATYAGLVTGGRMVWGEHATQHSRIAGLALQAAVYAGAGFVIWSRVENGRHNPSDVLAGSLIGIGMANLAYWRRFDTNGRARSLAAKSSAWRLDVEPGPAPVGIGLALRF